MEFTLVNNRDECSGCGACQNVCPTQAIRMLPDEYGFVFPNVNKDMCIGCGLCLRSCSYKTEIKHNTVKRVYAASINDVRIEQSSSGGIFYAIAKHMIDKRGYVAGVVMHTSEGDIYPKHVMICEHEKLQQLQGSKYAQSDTGNIYNLVKDKLNLGEKVLFSGTPCQVAGLKSFLKKEYDNLITVDVICHGVPSAQMFKDYLEFLSQKYKSKVYDYKFRDKKLGWGINMRVFLKNGHGKKRRRLSHRKCQLFFRCFFALI